MEKYLILFTSIVMRQLEHPNVCLKFVKEIEWYYKNSKHLWKDSEGLLTISETMTQYIKANINCFRIDPNLKF